MTVSQTTRLGINRWSAGADPFTRAQLDADHAALESVVAGFLTPSLASARPAASAANARFLHYATDTGQVSISTGSAWIGLLLTSGGTLTGGLNFADQLLTRPVLKDYAEEVVAHGNTGSTETIDLEGGNVHTATLDANCTFTFSNPTASGDACSFTLILKQDATGSRAVTWPASVDWAGGVAPTLSTAANAVDILGFTTVDGGVTWYGFVGGKAFA